MDKLTRLSAKEMLVLRLLINDRKEMYGLEMVEQSESKLKRGTVYTTLFRMEEKGYIKSRKEEIEETDAKAPRRLYKPTGLGERLLNAHEIFEQQLVGVI